MKRIELVELIEAEKLKLSPQARELWDELDAVLYMSSEERVTLTRQERNLMIETGRLPRADMHVVNRLVELRAGLYSSDYAKSKGRAGEPHRIKAVILAAMTKDRDEGRQLDPDMTEEQAVARLKEPD